MDLQFQILATTALTTMCMVALNDWVEHTKHYDTWSFVGGSLILSMPLQMLGIVWML